MQYKLNNADAVVIFDNEDEALVRQHHTRWYLTTDGYAGCRSRVTGKKVLMHRIIMQATERMDYIEHKDCNKINNQRSNLRRATATTNQYNKPKIAKQCSSKFKNVKWRKDLQKWQVAVTHNKKRIHGGYFSNEIEAAIHSNKLMAQYYGEFAILNVIN